MGCQPFSSNKGKIISSEIYSRVSSIKISRHTNINNYRKLYITSITHNEEELKDSYLNYTNKIASKLKINKYTYRGFNTLVSSTFNTKNQNDKSVTLEEYIKLDYKKTKKHRTEKIQQNYEKNFKENVLPLLKNNIVTKTNKNLGGLLRIMTIKEVSEHSSVSCRMVSKDYERRISKSINDNYEENSNSKNKNPSIKEFLGENQSLNEENNQEEIKININKHDANIDSSPVSLNISDEDFENIKHILNNHFLFPELPDEILMLIINELMLLEIEKDTLVYTENSNNGHFFFIVKSGSFELEQGEIKKTIGPWETFGELALLYKTKRTCKIKCTEDAEIFSLYGKIYRKKIYSLFKNEYVNKINCLCLFPLFKSLDIPNIQKIANKMIKYSYEKGTEIIKENETCDSLYIIISGLVEFFKSIKGQRFGNKLQNNDYFGVYDIFCDEINRLNIKALIDTHIYQISTGDLANCFGINFKNYFLYLSVKYSLINETKRLKFLMFDTFFENLKDKVMFKFYDISKFFEYKELVKLFSSSTQPNITKERFLLIVLTGKITYKKTFYMKMALFGEQFLPDIDSKEIDENYQIEIGRNTFICIIKWSDIYTIANSIMGLNLRENKIIQYYSILNHFKRSVLFENLSETTFLELCTKLEPKAYQQGEVIINENLPMKYLYFFFRGEIGIFDKNNVFKKACRNFNFYGEQCLISNGINAFKVVASTNISAFILPKETLFSYIGNNNVKYFKNKFLTLNQNDIKNIKLEDLDFINLIHKGKLGTISLVVVDNERDNDLKENKGCNNTNAHINHNLTPFAIKAIEISKCNGILSQYYKNEKEILQSLNHHFIVKLLKTFHNDKYIFFLMENIKGIPLEQYFSFRDLYDERQLYETKFYTANILLIVEYLKTKNLVYRNLNPTNLLINDKGYLTLINFNTCIKLMSKDVTSTIVGIPHFIAPEILLGKGYGYSVDYWSIGIIAYKLYFNVLPFGEDLTNPIDVFKEITEKELNFYGLNNDVTQFLTMILNKDFSERVCNLVDIKTCKLFQGFNWDELNDMKMKPPYIYEGNNEDKINDNNFGTLKMKYIDQLNKIRSKEIYSNINENTNNRAYNEDENRNLKSEEILNNSKDNSKSSIVNEWYKDF